MAHQGFIPMEKAQIIDNIASLDLESTKTNDIFAIKQ